jgi:hypothetical protein
MKGWAVAWIIATGAPTLGSLAVIEDLVATGGRRFAEVGTGPAVLHASAILCRRYCVRRIAEIQPEPPRLAPEIRSPKAGDRDTAAVSAVSLFQAEPRRSACRPNHDGTGPTGFDCRLLE